jgi:diacylglycerol kinase family enzyme
VLGSGCFFGVLPMGTFNYFGRTHGIPEAVDAAARVLVEGQLKPVQVGVVNDRVFLVNASLGLYPQLLEDREAAKRQFGRSRLVAFGSALKSLARDHRVLRLCLRTDEASGLLDTPTLFVGNNRLQLEQLGMAEAACVEQGRLAAIALRPVSQLGMLGLALRGSLGMLGDDANVVSFSARELTVSVASGKSLRIKVATDGEVGWMRLPLRFRVAAQPLALLCPAPAAAEG